MSAYAQNNPARNISNLSTGIGAVLLMLHIYFYNYPMFREWKIYSIFTDRMLEAVIRTGIFNDPFYSKGLAVFFILIGIAAAPNRKQPGDKWWAGLLSLSMGLWLYCKTSLLWDQDEHEKGLYIAYDIFTLLNVFWIMVSASSLARHIRLPWSKNDPFGRRVTGFPQSRNRIANFYSLNLEGKSTYKGRARKMWINLINPRRGVLILGAPGSGKSYFIIEPLIRQLMEKGISMLIYDFKYDALTRVAYTHFLANKGRYPRATGFYCIHFSDASRSHRCNVLAPESMQWLSDAMGISRTILLSLNRSWVDQQGNFFVESAVSFFGAVIWFLHEYKVGIYCTLPHAIELCRLPYDNLFTLLATEPSIATAIEPFAQAYENQTLEQLDGQMAGMRIPLGRLASPDIYYILTGNDLNLHLNDPQAPKILCLGGNANRMEAITPVLSLYIDRVNRICNQPKQYPCAMVCDEFATVRAASILTTMATGRANDIIPIIAVQDISQLRTLYTQAETDWIMNVNTNVLCGQLSGEAARRLSERFPQILRERASISVNSGDTSVSRHPEWEATVNPATVANLSSGEFLGVLSDNPKQEMDMKAFHAKIVRSGKDDVQGTELPVVREVNVRELQACYDRVKLDIGEMVVEMKREVMGH